MRAVFSLLALLPVLTAQSRMVVGYFVEWGIYQRNYQVANIPGAQLDVINYAFAQIDSGGRVAVYDRWAALDIVLPGNDPTLPFQGNFNALVQLKRRQPQLRTMISVGGWTLSAPFSAMAFTAAGRSAFSQSAVAFMRQYGFDGVDIDWEYPVSGGLQNGRPEDRHNFTLLLQQLRTDLDAQGRVDQRTYYLSIAAPAGPTTLVNLELLPVAQACDWINLMAYDFHGGWEMVADHQAPLFGRFGRTGSGDPLCVHAAVDAYVQAGVPASKLLVGAPFYGRGWNGVAAANQGLRQPATGLPQGTFETGVFDFWDLAARLQQQPAVYSRVWDDTAKAPFVWAPSLGGGTWIGYEDPESLARKVDYVKERGLRGVMFWELSGDQRSGPATLLGTLAARLKTPLTSDVAAVTTAQGGPIRFTLSNPDHAGLPYVLLLTLSGTSPGFQLPPPGAAHVPLNFDAVTQLTLTNLNTPVFAGCFGLLDANGYGTARCALPPTPGLTATLHAAFVQGGSRWDFASNAWPVALRP